MNNVISDVCRQLSADQKLTNGYNAIGFSQGGQFLYVFFFLMKTDNEMK